MFSWLFTRSKYRLTERTAVQKALPYIIVCVYLGRAGWYGVDANVKYLALRSMFTILQDPGPERVI